MPIHRSSRRRMACAIAACASAAAVFATIAAAGLAAQSTDASAAAAAAQASPALVGALSKEIGASPEQAAGAAGALFAVAKSRLSAADFTQVSKAVPGMDLLLKAAPATGGASSSGALSRLGATAGAVPGAASAFSTLGLSPDMAAKAVPVLTQFVTKSGGAHVGSLLASALK